MKKTALTLATLLCVTEIASASSAEVRQARWAAPLELVGVPNLHRVAPGLFRSAQPTAAGMRNLSHLGIVHVVSLRAFHSDRGKLAGTTLISDEFPVKTWHPERADVVRFLRVVAEAKGGPVLVHCQHGADRTGTMCAIYRVAVQGWSKRDAIEEMTRGGFGFHTVWGNLPRWIESLDIEALKRDAGMTLTLTI